MKNTKTLLTSAMTLIKTTPGTHLIGNDENGLKFYVPKAFFAASGCKPDAKFKMTIEEVH